MLFILKDLRQSCPRLVKRRLALVETNLSRNSQLETHRSDEPGSWVKPAPCLFWVAGRGAFSRIDRFPHALENSCWAVLGRSGTGRRLRTPRESCIRARSGAGADCSTDR